MKRSNDGPPSKVSCFFLSQVTRVIQHVFLWPQVSGFTDDTYRYMIESVFPRRVFLSRFPLCLPKGVQKPIHDWTCTHSFFYLLGSDPFLGFLLFIWFVKDLEWVPTLIKHNRSRSCLSWTLYIPWPGVFPVWNHNLDLIIVLFLTRPGKDCNEFSFEVFLSWLTLIWHVVLFQIAITFLICFWIDGLF